MMQAGKLALFGTQQTALTPMLKAYHIMETVREL